MYKEAKINFITLLVLFLIIFSVTVLANQDATISKVQQNTGITVGNFARFLITVSNTGSENLTALEIVDTWNPTYFSYSSFQTSDNFVFSSNTSNTVTWHLNLSNGSSPATMYINFTTLQAGNTTNNISVKNSTLASSTGFPSLFTVSIGNKCLGNITLEFP